MIWLTWRQHRKQALFALIGLAVLAALMIPTGLAMRNTFASLGLPDCVSSLGDAEYVSASFSNACNTALKQFNSQYGTLSGVSALFVFLPLLAGLFWGAPLVAREVEHGTHRMVWTQGVSRRQWALVKFGLIGAGTLIIAIVYGLGMSWWFTPLSQADNPRLSPLVFDVQGLAPIGYTMFAVALGILAGTITHKVLPAMAVTLVGFLGARIALTALARPNYLPARTLTFPVQGVSPALNPALGNWIESMEVRDATGKVVMSNAQVGCPPQDTACGGIGPGAYNWLEYQPGGRFWLFQSIETGIFAALAALLIYLAIRRIRRIA
jgi:ABC-type transport system involved in multi-copper enzyme maturation permease subunit